MVKFGQLLVDLDRQLLLKGSEPVILPNRDSALLFYLLRNAGRVVSKEELFEHVWAGRVVEETALPRKISQLRAAIGDTKHEIIRTVPKRGYLVFTDTANQQGNELVAMSEPEMTSAVEATPLQEVAFNQAYEDERSNSEHIPRATAVSKVSSWLMPIGLALVLILCLAFGAKTYFGSKSHVPDAEWVLTLPTAEGVDREILEAQLAWAGSQIQPPLRFSTAGLKSTAQPELRVSLDRSTLGSAVVRLEFEGKETKLPLNSGTQVLLQGLSQTLGLMSDRAVINEPLMAQSHAKDELTDAQLDFDTLSTQLLARYRFNVSDPRLNAQLAFALNEIGVRTWPVALAQSALASPDELSASHLCLMQFVIADSDYAQNLVAVTDALKKQKNCGLALARAAEARFDLPAVERALSLVNPESLLISFKRLEIKARTLAAMQSQAQRLATFDELVQLAQAAGWRRGLARIHETKADTLFSYTHRAEALEAYDIAGQLYRAAGDLVASQRVLLSSFNLQRRPGAIIAVEAQALQQRASKAGDRDSSLQAAAMLLKFGKLTPQERESLTRQVMANLSDPKIRWAPGTLEKLPDLLAAGLRPDLALSADRYLVEATKSYPRVHHKLLSQLGADAMNSGHILESVHVYQKLESVWATMPQLQIQETALCVGGYAAMEAKDWSLARGWLEKCQALKLPKQVACIPLFGEVGLHLLNRAEQHPASGMEETMKKIAGADPLDLNCDVIAILMASLAVRSSNQKVLEMALRFLENSKLDPGNSTEYLLLMADLCAKNLRPCPTQKLESFLAEPSRNAADRALVLAKYAAISKSCTSQIRAEATTALQRAIDLGAKLTAERIRCGLSQCLGESIGAQCPFGPLGLYL